jgi:hypothetical protein
VSRTLGQVVGKWVWGSPKMPRLELLNVKADPERELEDFVLSCSRCSLEVHWVWGLGITSGH